MRSKVIGESVNLVFFSFMSKMCLLVINVL